MLQPYTLFLPRLSLFGVFLGTALAFIPLLTCFAREDSPETSYLFDKTFTHSDNTSIEILFGEQPVGISYIGRVFLVHSKNISVESVKASCVCTAVTAKSLDSNGSSGTEILITIRISEPRTVETELQIKLSDGAKIPLRISGILMQSLEVTPGAVTIGSNTDCKLLFRYPRLKLVSPRIICLDDRFEVQTLASEEGKSEIQIHNKRPFRDSERVFLGAVPFKLIGKNCEVSISLPLRLETTSSIVPSSLVVGHETIEKKVLVVGEGFRMINDITESKELSDLCLSIFAEDEKTLAGEVLSATLRSSCIAVTMKLRLESFQEGTNVIFVKFKDSEGKLRTVGKCVVKR